MPQLKTWAEALMKTPGPDPVMSGAFLLGLFSRSYGGAMALRSSMYRSGLLKSYELGCRVISVGNLTLGGTGKTPMTLFLARRLKAEGRRVAVVSRGYGGRAEAAGGIVSDGKRICMGPVEAGDEAWLMATLLGEVPLLVGADRLRAGRLAEKHFSPEVILLDDGFQHRRLKRDLDLVLLDARTPLGNGMIFPRGPLREPPSALSSADALVLTRSTDVPLPESLRRLKAVQGKPILSAAHIPCIRGTASAHGGSLSRIGQGTDSQAILSRQRVLAFSGIAGNEDFHQAVDGFGAERVGTRRFGDHHRYRKSELAFLDREARQVRAERIVTTDKDFARLLGRNPFSTELVVVGVDLCLLSGAEELDRLLKERIL